MLSGRLEELGRAFCETQRYKWWSRMSFTEQARSVACDDENICLTQSPLLTPTNTPRRLHL
jgi:hypothetical protein